MSNYDDSNTYFPQDLDIDDYFRNTIRPILTLDRSRETVNIQNENGMIMLFEDKSIIFKTAENDEVIRIRENGNVYVRGEYTDTNKEISDAFMNFLRINLGVVDWE